jgi:hypothetical protein
MRAVQSTRRAEMARIVDSRGYARSREFRVRWADTIRISVAGARLVIKLLDFTIPVSRPAGVSSHTLIGSIMGVELANSILTGHALGAGGLASNPAALARAPTSMLWLVWSVFASAAPVVQAGPVVQVVRFDGNRAVATATLHALVERLGAALGDDEGPERLALAVTEVYFDAGYVTARVVEPRRASDGAWVVHIDEGARYTVRAISFSGAWPRDAAELRGSLRTHAGEAFNRARLVADIKRLAATVHGAVTPLTRLDIEHHTIDLELALVP